MTTSQKFTELNVHGGKSTYSLAAEPIRHLVTGIRLLIVVRQSVELAYHF